MRESLVSKKHRDSHFSDNRAALVSTLQIDLGPDQYFPVFSKLLANIPDSQPPALQPTNGQLIRQTSSQLHVTLTYSVETGTWTIMQTKSVI